MDVAVRPFSDNPYETQPGCPWMSKKTISNLTPAEYQMRWKSVDYPHSTIHRCIVVKHATEYHAPPAWSSSVVTLKRDRSAADFKTLRPSFTPNRGPHVGAPNPGRYLSDRGPLARAWRCGKYLISFDYKEPTRRVPLQNARGSAPKSYVRHYEQNGRHFVKTQREALCGTTEAPSKAVTDYPYAEWYSYYYASGANPTTYGVRKPSDVPDLKTRRESGRPEQDMTRTPSEER